MKSETEAARDVTAAINPQVEHLRDNLRKKNVQEATSRAERLNRKNRAEMESAILEEAVRITNTETGEMTTRTALIPDEGTNLNVIIKRDKNRVMNDAFTMTIRRGGFEMMIGRTRVAHDLFWWLNANVRYGNVARLNQGKTATAIGCSRNALRTALAELVKAEIVREVPDDSGTVKSYQVTPDLMWYGNKGPELNQARQDWQDYRRARRERAAAAEDAPEGGRDDG